MRINGDLLLRLRLDRGWTQEQAAERIGIDARTYRRYERREIHVTHRAGQFEIIRCIAAAFDLPDAGFLIDNLDSLATPPLPHPGNDSLENTCSRPGLVTGEQFALDRFAPIRIRITASYLDYLQRCIKSPPESILISDVTGLATDFSCWLSTNPVYQSVLAANSRCQASLRRAHGDKVPGVRRTFYVDPARLNLAAIERLGETLRCHLYLGIQAAIIYTGPNVPEDMIADLCLFGKNGAADFGHFEQLDAADTGPMDTFVSSNERKYSEIEEKTQWAQNPRNVDHVVIFNNESIIDVIKDLRTKIRKSQTKL